MLISGVQYLGLSLDAQYLGSILLACLVLEKRISAAWRCLSSGVTAQRVHPIFPPEVTRYFPSTYCNYKPHGIYTYSKSYITGGARLVVQKHPAACINIPGVIRFQRGGGSEK